MNAAQRTAYDARLSELESRYRAGELTHAQLNAAVAELDDEFHIGAATFTPKEPEQ